MRIIFLCGSLEPGRDGVGDYTRRLALEMIRHGHQVAAIALNDWHLKNEFLGEQIAEENYLQILRLPSNWPSEQRFARAKEWIDSFNPEWLSLQFVNFAFNIRGLHFGLGNWLAMLGKGRKWHIMFHELWVGMALEAPKKHILWGKIQRKLIKSLILKLKPSLIHTQSHLYLAQLARLGFKAEYLPLFSNIPKVNSLTQNSGLQPKTETDSNSQISFLVFGSIHPMSPVEQFAREAVEYAQKNRSKVSFTFIGRSGYELAHWVSVLQSENLNIELLGEQTPERISQVLSSASIGISTSSLGYIEKSGTVVAMLEHGLPVICVASPSKLVDMQYVAPPYGVLEYKAGNLEDCLTMKFELPQVNTLLEVSNLMEHAFEIKN